MSFADHSFITVVYPHTRMSESPKKQRLTPAQKVKFADAAKTITPIKYKKEVEVVVPSYA